MESFKADAASGVTQFVVHGVWVDDGDAVAAGLAVVDETGAPVGEGVGCGEAGGVGVEFHP